MAEKRLRLVRSPVLGWLQVKDLSDVSLTLRHSNTDKCVLAR